MRSLVHICVFILGFSAWNGLHAQKPLVKPAVGDTLPADTINIDTIFNGLSDTVREINITISKDSIDAKVEYGSADSNYLDNSTKRVYLFGDAFVKYKDLSLTADYIIVDLDSSIAYATGLPDSLGKLQGKPVFTMTDESFDSETIRYNFKSRKGFVYNAVTEERDLRILGAKTKFVAASDDPSRKEDVLYNEGALITSCDLDEPHYGIRARRVKTIPDKLAVVGPSRLELFGVPTPLWLPFGFYPVSETRTAGVIFPRDYERSPQWGFGLKELGYYFPIKDWADVRLTGDIYFNGSWGAAVASSYAKKYKFRGSVRLGFSNRITEASNSYEKTSAKSFSINLSHNQDAKAHPYQTIGGSVNIQTNNYQSLNYNDAASVLNSSYSSNFNYSRIFPDKPYSLTAGFNHSQNTRSHIVTINAPELNFRLNRIYPFKSKTLPGPDRWFEKIAFQYSGQGRAQITGTDTTLFDRETWNKAQWGAQHRASANTNFSVYKYFNFTPSIDYGETWFFKSREREFDFDPTDPKFVRQDTIYFPDSSGFFIQPDTINFGELSDTLISGFTAFRSISASISMNTQIFNTVLFKKGRFKGIRHVIKPSLGFSYAPKSPPNYYKYEMFSVAFPDSLQRYSRFDNLLFGVRPVDQEQALINYSFTNLFEAKYFSKRDSTDKRLKLFDNISAGGSYNIAADSFRFSPLNISGNTRLFKGLTTISVGATYSFYGLKDNFRLNRELYLKTDNKLLRFDQLRLRFSTQLPIRDLLALFEKKKSTNDDRTQTTTAPTGRLPSSQDKLFNMLEGFSISHELQIMRLGMIGKDTTLVSIHSVNMTGTMKLTPNWSIRFGNIGYDFKSKQITYPDIGLARDLHCWEMSFSFQPTRGTYAFHIGVKPGSFDFLKFPYKRGNYDTFGF